MNTYALIGLVLGIQWTIEMVIKVIKVSKPGKSISDILGIMMCGMLGLLFIWIWAWAWPLCLIVNWICSLTKIDIFLIEEMFTTIDNEN